MVMVEVEMVVVVLKKESFVLVFSSAFLYYSYAHAYLLIHT